MTELAYYKLLALWLMLLGVTIILCTLFSVPLWASLLLLVADLIGLLIAVRYIR